MVQQMCLVFFLQAAGRALLIHSSPNCHIVQESRRTQVCVMVYPSLSLSDLQISFLLLASQVFYRVAIYISYNEAHLYNLK